MIAILTITTRRASKGNSPSTPTIHRPPLTRRVAIVVVTLVSMLMAAPTAHASVGGELIKAMGRYLAKETGQEVTEQAVKQMTKQVGEELIERTAQKVVREGGEKSLVEVGELVAKHGPDVVRALDNAPDALPLLKLLNELPADEIGKAASRLAAGSTGKELAALGTKFGVVALRAEAKHPGVGVRFANALGSEGAELSLKLTSDQAIQIGRHVDDIAKLPATQQSQLMSMISSNADRFAAFVERFVEKNPGKVLFTAASTPIILANSAAIFGDGEVVFDLDGNVIRDANGNPIRHHTGLIPDAASSAGDVIKTPLKTTIYGAGLVVVLFLSVFFGSKAWKHHQKDRLELEASKNVMLKNIAKNENHPATVNYRS